jgi:hypothetical protein
MVTLPNRGTNRWEEVAWISCNSCNGEEAEEVEVEEEEEEEEEDEVEDEVEDEDENHVRLAQTRRRQYEHTTVQETGGRSACVAVKRCRWSKSMRAK